MWAATPSSTGPICTIVPEAGRSFSMTMAQLGLAKIASSTGRPTLRLSTSKAATISMSPGRNAPTEGCISPSTSGPLRSR